ncbi:hypothetical protein FKW77_004785 [Venturia effusa]|uniref:Uncharacterized protein n=1 Tax=Venturia effusa TaxID=50376 RepID=A0A517LNY0_9PEZI|nr:hypothetical protein FKW77_004785 [Venturia effusa]
MNAPALNPAGFSMRSRLEMNFKTESQATKYPGSDNPHCPKSSSRRCHPSRPTPPPRPSIIPGHGHAHTTFRSRRPGEHANPFITDHQDLDERDRAECPLAQYIELANLEECVTRYQQHVERRDVTNCTRFQDVDLFVTTESFEQIKVQSSPEKSTGETVESRQASSAQCWETLFRLHKTTETPISSICDELKEELQKAVDKVQSLETEKRTADLVMRETRHQLGLTTTGPLRDTSWLQLRKAQREVAIIKAKLEDE